MPAKFRALKFVFLGKAINRRDRNTEVFADLVNGHDSRVVCGDAHYYGLFSVAANGGEMSHGWAVITRGGKWGD